MSEVIEPLKIEVTSWGESVAAEIGRGQISLELRSDWAGDTETGFGEHVTQHLNIDQARQLRDWLSRAVDALDASDGES